jgi:hypothetical protein
MGTSPEALAVPAAGARPRAAAAPAVSPPPAPLSESRTGRISLVTRFQRSEGRPPSDSPGQSESVPRPSEFIRPGPALGLAAASVPAPDAARGSRVTQPGFVTRVLVPRAVAEAHARWTRTSRSDPLRVSWTRMGGPGCAGGGYARPMDPSAAHTARAATRMLRAHRSPAAAAGMGGRGRMSVTRMASPSRGRDRPRQGPGPGDLTSARLVLRLRLPSARAGAAAAFKISADGWRLEVDPPRGPGI